MRNNVYRGSDTILPPIRKEDAFTCIWKKKPLKIFKDFNV